MYMSTAEQERLANFVLSGASLFDVIRWRRISRVFKKVADKRLAAFTRIEVRMYTGIAQMHGHNCNKDTYEWHPHAKVMMTEDVKALIQLLSSFRHSVQQLFMDSPIIELLVCQINRQQVNILIGMLRKSRFTCKNSHKDAKQPTLWPLLPKLKKLTITSQSNQLEHLSRLLTYAVGVDFLYQTENMDLLCLKICMGTYSQWSQKPHIRMFRHVTKFRQWTDADSLGERYFQQFSGRSRQKQCRRPSSSS
uniref:F-box domain-containing protein n=1 Tax=Ditylenchus dipsaci TaxID=166011 RepID=A0A915D8R3_9BILA